MIELTPKQKMSRLQHVMTFIEKLGYDTSRMELDEAIGITNSFVKTIEAVLGDPDNEINDAFSK